jgi:hypothetical protein
MMSKHMLRTQSRGWIAVVATLLFLTLAGCGSDSSGGGGDDDGGQNNSNTNENINENTNTNGNTNTNDNTNTNAPDCPDGIDGDGDGYGQDCPAGEDCNDNNPYVHPDATEICNYMDDDCDGETDEGVLTPCGNCSQYCDVFDLEDDPFPMPDEDPNVDTNGVGRDPNGDIVLDQTNLDFNFLWIANRYDADGWGTVSKIDSVDVIEVARYYTVTCFGNPAYQNGDCLDVNGDPVQWGNNHPSRTAVDFNFDVWVANRAHTDDPTLRQPSATKIANALEDCIDRNNNNVIDTSADTNGNGSIELDCDGDGNPDDLSTQCTDGRDPEFLGLDDECVLHTTNYAAPNEIGRSVCLDAGDPYSGGAGNAWVGTYSAGADGNNEFYKLDGATGEILETVELPPGINVYGCTVDGQGVLWAAQLSSGDLTYFDTANTANIGPVLTSPYGGFYGIAVDSENSIWMGGWGTQNVIRYRPDRTSFDTLDDGLWTRIRTVEEGNVANTRGIAADLRGWIWVASNNGYIIRVPQNLPDSDISWADAAAQGAMRIDTDLGGGMIGVGVDFEGHVWGMSYSQSTATRVDLDANGNPVDLVNNVFSIPVGLHPYTYSDFTGYGLRNFTRPRGTYRYIMEGCGPERDTTWLRVAWSATTPQNTEIVVRVRTGDDPLTLGDWFGAWDTSPAVFEDPPQGPIVPNPARYIQVEFELSSPDQAISPVLHDFALVWDCSDDIPE